MEQEAILIGISQLGAVFAGFIAMFMVFSQSNGQFTAVDAMRARVILFSSFAVVLAALLPVVLYGLSIPGVWAWRIAAALYLIAGILITVDVVRNQMALDKTVGTPRQIEIIRLLSRVLNLALFLAGIAVFIGYRQGGVYVLMLLMNLTIAGLSFLSFAMHRLFR